MSKLYIIGNGFDRALGLKTSYSDFAHYCFVNNHTFFHQMNELFTDLDINNELWANFENALGYPDQECMTKSYLSNDSIIVKYQELESMFTKWLVEIENSLKEKTKIVTIASTLVDNESLFLTFNYTSSLEKVFSIPDYRILHIHGRVGDKNLIFGHTEDIRSDDPGEDPYIIEQRKYRKEFAKDVQISRMRQFVENKNITEIIIVGHSMNNVDMQYFKELSLIGTVKLWTIYYHSNQESANEMVQILQLESKCEVKYKKI